MPSTCPGDGSLGPVVVGCRKEFDFTIAFEEIVLSIVPSACFILLTLWRLQNLASRPKVVKGRVFRYWKLVSFTPNPC